MQSEFAHKRSNEKSSSNIVQIALLELIPLVIILVWIAVMYDKLLRNPILAMLLVLGVLVILFGGAIRFGPVIIMRAKAIIRESKKKIPEKQRQSLVVDVKSGWTSSSI